jgi:DNA-binding transcriptional ArsR family regulator
MVHPAMMRICACIEDAHMDPIWSLQSEVMKILASPRRLEILHLLAEEPKEVGRLAEDMGITQPNVSQHLAVMRAAGIVEAHREGREVRYQLTDPEVIDACNLMRGVLMRRLARLGELSDRPNSADERTPQAAPTASAG